MLHVVSSSVSAAFGLELTRIGIPVITSCIGMAGGQRSQGARAPAGALADKLTESKPMAHDPSQGNGRYNNTPPTGLCCAQHTQVPIVSVSADFGLDLTCIGIPVISSCIGMAGG